MIRKRTRGFRQPLTAAVALPVGLLVGSTLTYADPVGAQPSSSPVHAPGPAATVVTQESTTTDPRSLLRALPRVQIGGPPPVAPATPVRSGNAVQVPSASEEVAPAATPRVDDSPAIETGADPGARRGERSGILRRLPLVGRLVPEPKSPAEREAPEPTPTPPVLLPPPGPGERPASAPPVAEGENSPAGPNRISRAEASPSGDPNASASPPSSPSLPNFYAARNSEQHKVGSEPFASPTPAGVPRQPAFEGGEVGPSLEASLRAASPESSGNVRGAAPSPIVSHLNQVAAPTSTPRLTFPRLTSADFVAPPPEVEPNDTARIEYLNALAAAREGRHTEAAAAFRGFAQRYPSSRLAPRALFLAALVEQDPQEVAKNVALLRQFFPRSDYLTELELRGVISPGSPSSLSQPVSAQPTPEAVSPLRQINELSEEVAADYRYRNFAAGLAKLEASPLTPQSPELLDLQSQGLIALGDHVRAVAVIEKIFTDFPNYEGRAKLRLSYGLLLEDSGKYERAIAEYRRLIEEAPDSVEAHTARVRIQQLNELTR